MKESIAPRLCTLLQELGPCPEANSRTIVRRTAELLGCGCAVYAAVATGSGRVDFRACHNLPPHPSPLQEAARRLCLEIAAAPEPGPLSHAGRSEESGAEPAAARFRSFLGHRVVLDGRPAGVVAALDTRARRFNGADEGLIALMAGLLAGEDRRCRREEELSRRVALERMLKDLSTRAIAARDADGFIDHGLRLVGSRMGAGGAFLWEYAPAGRSVGAVHQWAAAGASAPAAPLPGTPVAELPWEAERLMRGEILRLEAPPSGPGAVGPGCGCLILPLFSNETFFGGIGLATPPGPPHWAPEDTLILQTAAEILMRCIENRRLNETLEGHRRDLEAAVERKTQALQRSNSRLADEAAAHQATIASLREREAELKARNQTLLELGNALATLVRRREAGPEEPDSCALDRIDQLVGTLSAPGQPGGGLQEELERLTAFLRTKSSFVYPCLTPMELTVVKLIREGRSNSEIASALGLSRRTVEVHRYNIRKKLQLDNSKVNLSTYFSTME